MLHSVFLFVFLRRPPVSTLIDPFFPYVSFFRSETSAELPGVSQDDIDLRVEGYMLTIRGEKRKERKDEAARIVERSYGSFQRSIQLPFAPDPEDRKSTRLNSSH